MIKKLFYYSIVFFALIACEPENETITFQLEVQLRMTDNENIPDAIIVLAKNENTGQSYQCITGSEGKVIFESLAPGFYSISAASDAFNAFQSIDLFENTTLDLNLIKGKLGGFIIKEVYYSGSETPAGNGYYSDQFIEIHNNSSDTLFADGLSIVIHASYGTKENPYAYLANDSVAIQLCYTIPGTGTEHPIAPGKSFIIAQDAMNHQTDALGNPNSPVNLSDSEFEFFATRYEGKDIDFAATNMLPNLFPYIGTDVMIHSKGSHAIALVRFNEDINDFLTQNMLNEKLAKIPNKWVEDAVEIMPFGYSYKRFDASLDAGMISIEAGAMSGSSIRRKVLSDYSSHRLIYQDTNNSANDFLHDVTPLPKAY